MKDFGLVGDDYRSYSEGIRGRLRHDLVFKQIQQRLGERGRVLDIGCGDGEMSLRLAGEGYEVTAVDPSEEMLNRLRSRSSVLSHAAKARLKLHQSDLDNFEPKETYDCVCCHGVLLYLTSSEVAVNRLCDFVSRGGVLSILTKNRLSTGVREALQGKHEEALRLILSQSASSEGNLGIVTRGDDPTELSQLLQTRGFTAEWYGIRLFVDHLKSESESPVNYSALFELESAVSSRTPYRELARLVHILGTAT